MSKKYDLKKIQTEGGEYRYRKTNNIKKLEFLVLSLRSVKQTGVGISETGHDEQGRKHKLL